MRRILQQLSISQKLTTFNLILGLTLISVGGALLFWQNHRMMQHALEQRVAQHGAMVSDNLVLPVEFEDWARAATIMEAFAKDPAVARAELRGVSNELIVSYYGPDERGERPVNDSMLHHQSIAIVDSFGLEIAWLEIYVSRAEVLAAAREMLVTITAILTLAVVLGLLIGHRSQRMVTQPLAQLTDLVRRVRATKNYRLRAEPLYPDDLGRLTEGVNAMLEIIQRRDVNLARTVELRTRELATQNARLEREVRQRERADRKAQSNQAKFENAFHNAPVGMALIVGDGALIKRNAMFDTLLGTRDEGSLNLLPFIEGEGREDVAEQLQQLVIGGINEFSCDAPFHTGDGRELTCALHFSAVREDSDFSYAVLQLQDATESRRLAAELAHQARHDMLTGLANRRAFEQALSELAAPSAIISYPLVIGLIDLDKFKAVNDTAGHAAGDALLQRVADTIRGSVRERDLVVRLGGDEFAVILKRCDIATGGQIAEVIRARMEDLVFPWEGHSFRVGASIGIVGVEQPEGSLDHDLQRADAACFAAKDGGRNRVCVAEEDDAGQGEPNAGEVHWAQRLRVALESDEFVLFGQAMMAAGDSASTRHAEVLLRMRDGDGAPSVLPGAFLPVADRYGLANELDRWVLRQLISRLSGLGVRPADHFWINLSPSTLEDETFADYLTELRAHHGLAPGMLNFELRESAVLRHGEALLPMLERLKEQGCRIAVDGFEGSISSFECLRQLPIDMIKIDGTHVRAIAQDPIERVFVRAMVEAAQHLDIHSCAMHTESQASLSTALTLGVDYAQGHAIEAPRALFAEDLATDRSGVAA